ncbi:MAG: hypothetical protein PHO46_05280 [Thermoguttaceae bacterium]|nr:hypothetical protein [Thermoguttaceae bacterium]
MCGHNDILPVAGTADAPEQVLALGVFDRLHVGKEVDDFAQSAFIELFARVVFRTYPLLEPGSASRSGASTRRALCLFPSFARRVENRRLVSSG